ARTTLNKYSGDTENRFGASSDPTSVGVNGGYNKRVSNGEEVYSDLLVSASKPLSENLNLNAVIGASNTVLNYREIYNGTDGALTSLSFPDFFSVMALTGNFVKTEDQTKQISRAVFATANFGFKETLFIDATARNEWSSTVSKSFFYPSLGLSYILSENLTPSDLLSFIKLRATYAEVGNSLPFGADAISPNRFLSTAGDVQGIVNLPFFDGDKFYPLNPERTRSYEFGTEMRFF